MFMASTDQVEQRKEKYPDDVNKVPVQAGNLDRGVIFRAKSPEPGLQCNEANQADSDNHVQRRFAVLSWQNRTTETVPRARLRLMNREVRPVENCRPGQDAQRICDDILIRFDAERNTAPSSVSPLKSDRGPSLTNLNRLHRKHHHKTAGQQDGRVGTTERHVQVFGSLNERRRILGAIIGVPGEQPPKNRPRLPEKPTSRGVRRRIAAPRRRNDAARRACSWCHPHRQFERRPWLNLFDRIIIRRLYNDWRFVEVECRRRRGGCPLEVRRIPGIRRSHAPILQRPNQVDQRQQVAQCRGSNAPPAYITLST